MVPCSDEEDSEYVGGDGSGGTGDGSGDDESESDDSSVPTIEDDAVTSTRVFFPDHINQQLIELEYALDVQANLHKAKGKAHQVFLINIYLVLFLFIIF